jgi:hypothetical protein
VVVISPEWEYYKQGVVVDIANRARNGGRQAGSSAGAVFAPQSWPRSNLLHCQHTYRHKLQPQEVAVVGGLTYVDSKVLILASYFIFRIEHVPNHPSRGPFFSFLPYCPHGFVLS